MRSLRSFEASARHLSFSRAALELNLTPSAISHQMRALEGTLGVKLFERLKQGLFLTEVGAFYALEVRTRLQQLEAATLEVITHQAMGGVLNLAILPTFGTRWLIPRIGRFSASHPEITINFTTKAMAFDFSIERLDAAIHFGDANWPGVVAHRLMGEDVVVVCSPKLLRSVVARGLHRLHESTLLQHTTRPDAWEEWLSAVDQSTEHAHIGPRFELFSMVVQAAVAGIGVAVMPRFLVEEELALDRLAIPFDIQVRSRHAYFFVYPHERSDFPPLRTFRTWLMKEVERPQEE